MTDPDPVFSIVPDADQATIEAIRKAIEMSTRIERELVANHENNWTTVALNEASRAWRSRS